jgi:2',3'-cyclic-nucleotide 2'-phosphodiesterase/3'-nucleotidase
MSANAIGTNISDKAAQVRLRILATTDLHACLTAWDYYAHKLAEGRGLSRVAQLITAARAEVENALLFDNGDFLSGSGIGDLLAAQFPAQGVHPMIAAMNDLGYDAVNLGNHEFSHGLPFLRHSAKDARFPVLSSNFAFDDLPFARQTLLLNCSCVDGSGQKHDLKVGVMGLLPAQTLVWEAAHLNGHAYAAPMLTAAKYYAATMRAAGADIVIALAHTGLAQADTDESTGENLGEEHLANSVAALAGIDVVIAGHTHQQFPSEQGGEQGGLVQPGFFGSHLGVVDVVMQRLSTGWQVVSRHAQLRAIAQRTSTGQVAPLVSDAAQIRALAEPAHAFITKTATQVIGHADKRLHSYFATITSSAALSIIAQAQSAGLAAMLAGGPDADLPILSAVAPFKAGGRGGPENYTDLAAGPLLHHHAADLYMHPNRLVGFRVTGAEVALWLERAVSTYFQIDRGARNVQLLNADFPSFNCDMIFGLTYEVDISQPPMFNAQGTLINPNARRVRNICHQGQPMRDDQVFALASNSYRREGKSGFAGTSQTHVMAQSPQMIQDLLREHITRGHPIPQPNAAHWRFAPIDGASVWFSTSPNAVQVLGDIDHFQPESIGLDETGFLRFRLHL